MRYQSPELEILHERYAGALMDIAEESGKLDEIEDNLSFITGLIKQDKKLARILQHPEISREDKLNLLKSIFKKADFCDEFFYFMQLLVKKNSLGLMHGIFLKYRDR